MNRIDSIKNTNERRRILMIERKNEFSMLKEVEYQVLVDKSVNDIEFLLNEVERLKEALKTVYELDGYMFVKEVLKKHETKQRRHIKTT